MIVATPLTSEQLRQASAEALDAPKDAGIIDMLVVRRAVDAREIRQEVYLSPETGVEGDRWQLASQKDPDHLAQIAVINTQFLKQIAGNDRDRMAQAGDNIVVDMDLSEANLPIGSRLRAGEVLFEVTSKAHLGCAKLSRRFGQEVLRFVNQKENRPLRLRGVYFRVLKAGVIRLGDRLEKIQ